MTSFTRDYSKSDDPKADALADIQFYLGDGYEKAAKKLRDFPDVRMFQTACWLLGIEGLPIAVWYDHLFGLGKWDQAWFELEYGE